MKKYTLFLFVFAFICFGFLGFNVKSTKAYDSGCIGSGLYSINTGQLCDNSQYGYSNNNYSNNYSYGCTSTGPFNIVTGQLCDNSQYGYSNNNNYSNNYSYGCTSTGPFNIVTGQLCDNSQYGYSNYNNNYSNNNNYSYGCTSTGSFNIITGQLCSTQQYGYSNYNNNYSNNNNYSYGCTSTGPFNIITGQLCNTSQYSNTYQNTYPYYNQTPTISGINGPQTLNVNQTGTWTVSVTGINNGNLTYSVNWGDQPVYAYGANSSSVYLPQQNATFTHTYIQTGTYTPVFTVTNSSGQSANTSLSVDVSGSSSYISPVIYSITPNYGPIRTQVTIYGTGFTYNNCTAYSCGNSVTTNTVNFGGSVVQNVYSYNGTNLTFTVPSSLNNCSANQYCPQTYMPVSPGTYPIYITNPNGVSNSVNFTVTY